jgi:uncharacterized YccA/Bax inhibitor family protein
VQRKLRGYDAKDLSANCKYGVAEAGQRKADSYLQTKKDNAANKRNTTMKPMTKTKLIALALAPAAMFAFSACTNTKPSPFAESNPKASHEKGVPGGVIVDSYKDITARVTEVDAPNRTVTVVGEKGDTTTFLCGPEVINFDQIHVGDKLKVRLTELLSAGVADPNLVSADGSSALVLLAPKGAMPAAAVAETTQITATVTGIDTLRHIVSLRFPDGTLHHYAMRKDVDIAKVKHGQKVVIRRTMATAIWVEKA